MIRPEAGLEFLPGLFLVRPLGRGGMGEAWVARDLSRDEEVVAKVLPAEAPADQVALLRREARLVRKLDHPRVVPVYGFEQGENGSAVLLRYMRGGDASSLRGAAPGAIVGLARDVAEALAYLHGQGVVHRDVKASNVLLDGDGRAHLADFGIAAVAARGEDEIVLGGGSRGSMSPQQRRGEPADPADDVYALGVLLDELLSGRTDASVPALRDLVRAMRAEDARDRPTTGAVLRTLTGIEAGLDPGVGPDRASVRLQAPPRVRDVAVLPSRESPARPSRPSRPPLVARPFQAALLTALALGATFVAIVLPRLVATARDAPPPLGSSSEAIPGAPASSLPAEAPPSPPAVSPTPAPPAVVVEATPPPPTPLPTPRPRLEPDPETARADPSRAEFERAMSEAQAALDALDLAAARAALDRAAALRPGEASVVDARRRLVDAERTSGLARHREAARDREAREDWRAAAAEYEAALRIDPTVAFALDGRARARRRALLAEKLDFHASHEDRLSAEAVFREAEGVLADAREVRSPGPRHRAQLEALERALARSRTAVTVELQSDGVTQVVVHSYGTLGAFKQKSLELRPGTYVVVGTRRGFRDVRRTLVVDPGIPPAPLVVRCEESI